MDKKNFLVILAIAMMGIGLAFLMVEVVKSVSWNEFFNTLWYGRFFFGGILFVYIGALLLKKALR